MKDLDLLNKMHLKRFSDAFLSYGYLSFSVIVIEFDEFNEFKTL